MTSYSAFTTLTTKASAEALGEALENMLPAPTGVGVFEMEDGSGIWEVAGYFTEAPDLGGLALLEAMHGAKAFVVSDIPETDWVAKVKRDLAPVEAGRFFVYGSHDADKLPTGSEPLLIEAAMAFGTGHHGTTLGCLRALDHLANEGFAAKTVADIGCGTAVLAMGAARLWDARILASDIDEVAVDVALANAKANGLAGRIECIEAAGFDHPDLASAAPFELIFANILKGPLLALAPEIAANLTKGGYAILSGILNEQAEEVLAVYARNGINEVRSDVIGDWTTLLLTN
ncbi:50S ribosomal protein L11 methyltransferase [Lentibacter algarum]|uniref:50S ribosomal protein L11 methyltransferase n=1 Tax=Lentibacter algarum TaxID=576131 RepID=UPI001C069133|nr:50S ribosomal protein L11 methyltransferase [Lentibacter algarum]MBU2980984.1 50S ribosomal protein L11 methyltransferase [Lentibacter algarum]